MKKMKMITGMVLALLLVTGLQAQTVTPSKKYVTRELGEVKDFNSIMVVGSPDVEYRQGSGKASVSIHGSDNLVGLVEVSSVNGVLRVNYKKGVKIMKGERRLKVVVTSSSLVAVDVEGSADIDLKGTVRGEGLKLSVIGSGDIIAEALEVKNIEAIVKGSGDIELKKVKADAVRARVDGMGDIDIRGVTRQATLLVNGSGDISAYELVAKQVESTVAGSGDIECHATERLDMHVSGSGDIEYKGKPTVVNKKER